MNRKTVPSTAIELDARWRETENTVDVVIEIEVNDWKDVGRRETVLPVAGRRGLCVALETFVWFGEEENFGDGDTDFADVFLGISASLEYHGESRLSSIRIGDAESDGAPPWKCEPALGTTTRIHNLSRSVAGIFGKHTYHLTLRPED